MNVELGLIEAFYGRPWTWESREATIECLSAHGYRCYLYAPKSDAHLRRRWQQPHPPDTAERLAGLAAHCRARGVRFGVGLSPYEAYLRFERPDRDALARKLAFFDELGLDDLAILFDDMRGDLPDLATRQAELVGWIAERTAATRIFVCPTYYSDDPVLDRVFGARPPDYLTRLGRLLDPAIELFWTGEEVCAREIAPAHLNRVAEQVGRRPFIWDNYPVNDGQRMSRHLHLRGFTGRPAALADAAAGHCVNPALQPVLTRIPAITLAESYRLGPAYAYGDAFRRAAVEVLGEDLGRRLREDLLVLQDVGLDRLTAEQQRTVRERYGADDHGAAREIIAWLDGEYAITDEIVRTQ